jgi:ATP:ADP antiporter, AAA family
MAPHEPTRLDRLLRLFADVRPGEGATVLLLALNVLVILQAYYILKPVREALILGEGSAELKSYMSVGQVALLMVVVPLYARLVARVPRMRLIRIVTWIFVGCLLVFYALARLQVPVGIAYFLWIGIFSLMIVAQFWSFANDLYTKDEGERLFPIVGFGASLGAVAGSIGPHLTSIGLMLLVLYLCDATGEYILAAIVKDRASDLVAAGRANGLTEGALIGRFYSRYFALVNIVSLLLQLFVVSRIVKRLGVGVAVGILPALSAVAFATIAFVPGLGLMLAATVAQKSTDYSLNNTVRNMLFLPCTREEKYSAKQVIDSLFVRLGDVLSAALVFAGTTIVGLTATGFAKVSILLSAAALALAVVVGRGYGQRTAAPRPAAGQSASGPALRSVG